MPKVTTFIHGYTGDVFIRVIDLIEVLREDADSYREMSNISDSLVFKAKLEILENRIDALKSLLK